MLRTPLTERFGLTAPVVGAPMAGVAGGAMAAAVGAGGGLGMIGVGSATPTDWIAEQARLAAAGGRSYGFGLMTWALAARPELLPAVLAAGPALVALSFGDPTPYAEQVHAAGAALACQVNDVAAARTALAAGADFVVAQGSEAGGHTGPIGTLPLLQAVLDAVDAHAAAVPVLAAGGIASPAGLAAVLAAGAAGCWVGTALLGCPEGEQPAAARRRVLAAAEMDTVLTRVFDLAAGIGWPSSWPGRALRNDFTERWHGREASLVGNAAATAVLRGALAAGDFATAYVYAGQAVALVHTERPAAEVIRWLADGAESILRDRLAVLFEEVTDPPGR